MTKIVLSLGLCCLCLTYCFAQTRIAYCDMNKALPFMPEMKEVQNTKNEYDLFFTKRMEEKEQAYQSAFNAYLEFAKRREVEEDDEKKVALENEVVALHNEVKYLEEQMDFAFKKIQTDAKKQAEKHLLLMLSSFAKEARVDYVLNKPFLFWSEIEIDFTNKAIEKASLEESSVQALLRGGNN